MSYTDWSTSDNEIWCNLSVSSRGDKWSADVEIDHQTIAYGESGSNIEAMRIAIHELDKVINRLIAIKSNMVYYLVENETK